MYGPPHHYGPGYAPGYGPGMVPHMGYGPHHMPPHHMPPPMMPHGYGYGPHY